MFLALARESNSHFSKEFWLFKFVEWHLETKMVRSLLLGSSASQPSQGTGLGMTSIVLTNANTPIYIYIYTYLFV